MQSAIGANWFDTYAGPDSGLPLVGPLALFFHIDEPEECERLLMASPLDVQEVVKRDVGIARGETAGLAEYYDAFPKGCRVFLPVARMAIQGAFLTKDGGLFRRFYADVGRYPSAWPTPEGKLATEIFMAWVNSLCFIPTGYPDWMERCDWTGVPVEWRYQACYVASKMLLIKCQFETALALAGTLRLFNRQDSQLGVIESWMTLVSAIACRELGRHAEMVRWFRHVAECVADRGFFLPFLSYSLGTGSPLVSALQDIAPALVPKIREYADNYYLSSILARNFLTGSQVTTILTRREFYIACCLKRHVSYTEIAARTGVSVGRARNIISDIYAKLGVHGRDDLTDLVW